METAWNVIATQANKRSGEASRAAVVRGDTEKKGNRGAGEGLLSEARFKHSRLTHGSRAIQGTAFSELESDAAIPGSGVSARCSAGRDPFQANSLSVTGALQITPVLTLRHSNSEVGQVQGTDLCSAPRSPDCHLGIWWVLWSGC